MMDISMLKVIENNLEAILAKITDKNVSKGLLIGSDHHFHSLIAYE
jgi:hypothetical protein